MEPQVTLEPLAVRRSTAAKLLECGSTKIWELVRDGKLQTVRVGADQRVTVESIREFVKAGGDK